MALTFPDDGPIGEGWSSVTLLDRAQAARIGALRFEAAPALRPQAAPA